MLPYTSGPSYDLIQLQDTFGGVILAAGYVGLLLLLCTLPLFRTVFRPIGKAGRMSLTTYITQSIVATLIFYSYGFGLYGSSESDNGNVDCDWRIRYSSYLRGVMAIKVSDGTT